MTEGLIQRSFNKSKLKRLHKVLNIVKISCILDIEYSSRLYINIYECKKYIASLETKEMRLIAQQKKLAKKMQL